MTDKILQVIPTDGKWFAKFMIEGEVCTNHLPLVCWALMEDEEGNRYIDGIDTDDGGTMGGCISDAQFVGFVRDGAKD